MALLQHAVGDQQLLLHAVDARIPDHLCPRRYWEGQSMLRGCYEWPHPYRPEAGTLSGRSNLYRVVEAICTGFLEVGLCVPLDSNVA